MRHHLGQSSRKARVRTIHALHEAGAIYYRKHLAGTSPALVNALVYAALRARASALVAGAWLEGLARRERPGSTPPAGGREGVEEARKCAGSAVR